MNNPENKRVVALVDMDCFFCQVETRLNPSLKGKPVAVVQYNQWKGGGIIAVNYEARELGVTRHMRGDEAKEKCPELILVSVPTVRGKADLTNYRDAGEEVAKVFSEFCECVQRASIDEAYLDLTKTVEDYIKSSEDVKPDDLPNTFVIGHCLLGSKNEEDRALGVTTWLQTVELEKMTDKAGYQLAVGAKIIEKMRAKVFEKTGFHCSAGIAHNKILAKLTAGLHKPQKQTVLPNDSVPELYDTLPIHKVRNLGGKFGKKVAERLSIKYMSELYKFSLQDLQQKFDEKASFWLYNIARGIDFEPVTPRLKPESIGCSKNFTGTNQLRKKNDVEHWLNEMSAEISERLHKDYEKNKRRAKLLTVSLHQESSTTKCGPLNSYDATRIASDALQIIKKFNSASIESELWIPPIKFLGMSASKFCEEVSSIEKFFKVRDVSAVEGKEPKVEDNSAQHKKNGTLSSANPSTSDKVQFEKNQRSFFINYIRERKEKVLETVGKTKSEMDDEEENECVNGSDVIPDVNEAEIGVSNILPEPLQNKFNDKFNCNLINQDVSKIRQHKATVSGNNFENEGPSEKCNECGKEIPLSAFLEHLDYHVALCLSREINAEIQAAPKITTVESEIESKRKKYATEENAKKIKNITSFFSASK